MAGPKRNYSRPIETLGVAKALDHIRDDVVDSMRTQFLEWLTAERANGRLEVAEDLLHTLANKAASMSGPIAREKSGTGVAEAFQLGINKSATDLEYEATTDRIEFCSTCGAPRSQPTVK